MARATRNTSPKNADASATPAVARTSTPSRARSLVADEQTVRVRAYEIYLQRGGGPGSPEDDWRRAERELRGQEALR